MQRHGPQGLRLHDSSAFKDGSFSYSVGLSNLLLLLGPLPPKPIQEPIPRALWESPALPVRLETVL